MAGRVERRRFWAAIAAGVASEDFALPRSPCVLAKRELTMSNHLLVEITDSLRRQRDELKRQMDVLESGKLAHDEKAAAIEAKGSAHRSTWKERRRWLVTV